jgi:hypothetical protein
MLRLRRCATDLLAAGMAERDFAGGSTTIRWRAQAPAASSTGIAADEMLVKGTITSS